MRISIAGKNLTEGHGLPTSPVQLDMEAFHLLSRGGVKFDKQKYRDDVKLFNVSIVIPISRQSDCSCFEVEVNHREQGCDLCGKPGG